MVAMSTAVSVSATPKVLNAPAICSIRNGMGVGSNGVEERQRRKASEFGHGSYLFAGREAEEQLGVQRVCGLAVLGLCQQGCLCRHVQLRGAVDLIGCSGVKTG